MSPPIRTVLVDDHQILREGVRRLLIESGGHPGINVIGEAGDCPEARGLLERLHPDVLVLDLALPKGSGLDICVQARAKGIPVVILTMHASAEHVRRARSAGASAYVVKGSGVSELAEAIRGAAAGRTGTFPVVAADPITLLTVREREVLVHVASGKGNKEIAADLGISVHTVNTHRTHLMEKLRVHDVVALTRLAIDLGLT